MELATAYVNDSIITPLLVIFTKHVNWTSNCEIVYIPTSARCICEYTGCPNYGMSLFVSPIAAAVNAISQRLKAFNSV
jgi:hypothetical protein